MPLSTVDNAVITQMDQFAKDRVEEVFQGDELELLWKYNDREFYNADTDHWFPHKVDRAGRPATRQRVAVSRCN
ncbi:MAG: hypothetical protein R3C10_18410 [Pirellulales bacterium]